MEVTKLCIIRRMDFNMHSVEYHTAMQIYGYISKTVESKKPVTEENILCNSIYMKIKIGITNLW